MRRPVLALTVLLAAASAARAQHAGHAEHTVPGAPPPAARPDPDAGMPLFREALGPFARPVGAAPEAQAYFDQGMQLMYAFARPEAVRSFREAQRRDSTCAMCAWGEAWARGAYLNEPMDSAGAPEAYAAAQRAVRLAAAGTARPADRALAAAVAARYAPAFARGERRRLDSAYAEAMARVRAAHPRDADVATLYAEALMLLRPRRAAWDTSAADVRTVYATLERALALAPAHPGACHLYIHATENSPVSALAETCAGTLGSSIPGASHINHMPSHTFNRVGRWGDAVRANIAAWHSDLRSPSGGGFAIYPAHNLHMLLFSASYDGQGAVAEQAARDLAKLSAPMGFYRALVLLRFGRFDEVLALGAPAPDPIPRGLSEFARGYALLRRGDTAAARSHLAAVEFAARTVPDSAGRFRGHAASALLGTAGGILRGEILRAEGKLPEAIAAFERAVSLEDGLAYDEPEPLPFAARDWLGAALLEAGRAADAERVYRAALDDHPRNGWSLVGLERALRAQGKAREADQAKARLAGAWARSDTWVRESRF